MAYAPAGQHVFKTLNEGPNGSSGAEPTARLQTKKSCIYSIEDEEMELEHLFCPAGARILYDCFFNNVWSRWDHYIYQCFI
jgi:hypothetical protein